MEFITDFISTQAFQYTVDALAAIAVAWIFKNIPNDKIKKAVGFIAYKLGIICTLGMSRWKLTAKFWNKIIEPWFVDLIDNIAGEFVREFIRGLRTDNKE